MGEHESGEHPFLHIDTIEVGETAAGRLAEEGAGGESCTDAGIFTSLAAI